MIRRSTFVIVLFFVLLLILAWYLQTNDSEEPEDAIPTSTPMASIFVINSEDLTRLQIIGTDGNQLILEKDDQGVWQLTEPTGYQADPDKVNTLVNNVLSLKILTNLESQVSLDALGLDNPSYRIRLTKSIGETYTAIVGATTPTDSGYYVKIGEQSYVVVAKNPLDNVLDSLSDPPIIVTPTPTVDTQSTGTQIPLLTPSP